MCTAAPLVNAPLNAGTVNISGTWSKSPLPGAANIATRSTRRNRQPLEPAGTADRSESALPKADGTASRKTRRGTTAGRAQSAFANRSGPSRTSGLGTRARIAGVDPCDSPASPPSRRQTSRFTAAGMNREGRSPRTCERANAAIRRRCSPARTARRCVRALSIMNTERIPMAVTPRISPVRLPIAPSLTNAKSTAMSATILIAFQSASTRISLHEMASEQKRPLRRSRDVPWRRTSCVAPASRSKRTWPSRTRWVLAPTWPLRPRLFRPDLAVDELD